MSRFLALAGLSAREFLGARNLGVFVAYLLGLYAGHQTLRSGAPGDAVKHYLSFGTSLALVLTTVLTLFHVAFSLPADLEFERLAAIFAKPVRRFEFLAARFAGVTLVTALMLGFCFLGLVAVGLCLFSAEELTPRTRLAPASIRYSEDAPRVAATPRVFRYLQADRGHEARWRFDRLPETAPRWEGRISGRLRHLSGGLRPLAVEAAFGATGEVEPRRRLTVSIPGAGGAEFSLDAAAFTEAGGASAAKGLWVRLRPLDPHAALGVEDESLILIEARAALPLTMLRATWVSLLKVLVPLSWTFACAARFSPFTTLIVGAFVAFMGASTAFTQRVLAKLDPGYPGLFSGLSHTAQGRPVQTLHQIAASTRELTEFLASIAPDLQRPSLERTLVQGYDVSGADCGAVVVECAPALLAALVLAFFLFARRDLG